MSSFTLYDRAIKNKIQNVFNNIVISEPDLAFKRAAERDGEEGKVKFPLLSLYREDESLSQENFNWKRLRKGENEQYLGDKEAIQALKVLPIRLDYQLDVYAEKKIVADKLLEELLFYLSEDFSVKVVPPETKLILIDNKFYINNYVIGDDVYSVEIINSGEADKELSVNLENYKLSINLAINSEGELDDEKNTVRNIVDEINKYDEFNSFIKSDEEDVIDGDLSETEIKGVENKFDYVIEDISDNSELMGFEERGRYYRKTILFYLDNVRLYASNISGHIVEFDYSLVDIDENLQ